MASQQLKNRILSELDSLISRAKTQIKNEGKKKLQELKNEIPTPQEIVEKLKAEINSDTCSDKGQEKFLKIYNTLNDNLTQLEDLVNDPDFDLLYTDNLQFDAKTKFKGTKITEIMTLVQEARDDAFSDIEDLEFTSPNGNKVTLSEEIDKMRDNKADYKSGALPSELEGLL